MGLIELANSPLPVVLAIFGAIALLLALIGSIEGDIKINITPGRQRILFLIGVVFIALGLVLYILPKASTSVPPTATPTVVNVTPTSIPPTPQITPTGIPSRIQPITTTHTLSPTVPPPVVLFADDFKNGLSSEWQWDRNLWKVKNQQVTNAGCGMISVGSKDWNQYTLSFDFQLPANTDGSVQVLFGIQDEENYWATALLTQEQYGAVGLLKRNKGSVTWPPGIPSQVNDVFQANESNHFELEVQDTVMQVHVNDQTVYDVDLGEDLSGPVGLRACPGSLSWIDNLQVVALSN